MTTQWHRKSPILWHVGKVSVLKNSQHYRHLRDTELQFPFRFCLLSLGLSFKLPFPSTKVWQCINWCKHLNFASLNYVFHPNSSLQRLVTCYRTDRYYECWNTYMWYFKLLSQIPCSSFLIDQLALFSNELAYFIRKK